MNSNDSKSKSRRGKSPTRTTRKTSVGVAICRYNPETKMPEIYLVQNRITYAFSNFVLGRFHTPMQDLMNNMSVSEKCLIRSDNFDAMWEHIWLSTLDDKKQSFYNNRHRHYNKIKKSIINRCIDRSTSQEPGWEIPKGRLEKGEKPIKCAMREVYEETGANPFQYKIIGNTPKITYSYQIGNTIFTIKYFVAGLIGHIEEGVDMSQISQVVEARDARWVALKDIPFMDMQHSNTKDVIKKCLKIFKEGGFLKPP